MSSSSRLHVLLFRHGQRAPGRYLPVLPTPSTSPLSPTSTTTPSAPLDRSQSLQLWKDLIFDHHSHQASCLQHHYPISMDPSLQQPSDLAHFPFGALTMTGINHMRTTGQMMGKTFPGLVKAVKDRNVHVAATNYRRTQMSAQFLIDGILHHTSASPCSSTSPSSSASMDAPKESSPQAIPIHVRSHDACSMTFYENTRIPKLVRKLVRQVQRSKSFDERENAMDPVKKAMLAAIPTLIHPGYGGFDWPTAFDYFTCLTAHNMPIHPTLQPHTKDVLQHFVFRYWSYYRDPEHAAHYVQPLLQEMIDAVTTHFNTPVSLSTNKALLYSAHDITLFAVLSVLGAKRVVQGPLALALNDINQIYDIWPHYGSVLSLEISSTQGTLDDDKIVFEAHYNASPLPVDLGYYKEHLSYYRPTRDRSLQDELAINEELLQRRDSLSMNEKKKVTFTLKELKELNALLKQYVHYNHEYDE